MSFVQTEMAVYRYGDQLNVPVTPGEDHNAGDVVDLGTTVAIYLEFAKSGVPTNYCRTGVFDILKQDGEEINVDDIVLWDASNHRAYVTGGGYSDSACIGKCVAHSATTDLTVSVLLNPYAATAAG